MNILHRRYTNLPVLEFFYNDLSSFEPEWPVGFGDLKIWRFFSDTTCVVISRETRCHDEDDNDSSDAEEEDEEDDDDDDAEDDENDEDDEYENQDEDMDYEEDTGQISRLEKFSIVRHGLTDPNRGLFVFFKNLKFLDLSRNFIRFLDDYIFADLVNLEHLVLAYNDLTEIRRKTLIGLNRLKRLDLKYNPLEWFNRIIFKKMKRLKKVELSTNMLLTRLQHKYKDRIVLEDN